MARSKVKNQIRRSNHPLLVLTSIVIFLTGALYDHLGSYMIPFLCAGIPPIVGASILFTISCVKSQPEVCPVSLCASCSFLIGLPLAGFSCHLSFHFNVLGSLAVFISPYIIFVFVFFSLFLCYVSVLFSHFFCLHYFLFYLHFYICSPFS